MSWLDAMLLILLAGAVLSSWRAGLVQEVFTFGGLIAGIILAGQLYRPVAGAFAGPSASNLNFAVAFLAILMAVWLAAGIGAQFMRAAVRTLRLGWLDRAGGILFGVLKGIVWIFIIVIVLRRFPFYDTDSLLRESSIADWAYRNAQIILALLPREF
jgi:membrane protein required for colicin V production